MDEEITYEEIRNIYRKEINSSSLVKLPNNFYEKSFQLLKNLIDSKQSSKMVYREIENLKNTIWEIYLKRSQKIVFKVSKRMPHDSTDLSQKEHEFYDKISKQYVDYIDSFNLELDSILNPEKKQEISKKQEKDVLSPNTVPLKIIEEVSPYRSEDGVIFGPFKKNEIVYVPRKEAEFLVDSNYAKYA